MRAIIDLEETGIDVPKDVSISGIDGILFSFLVRPALTTIRVPGATGGDSVCRVGEVVETEKATRRRVRG